MDTIEPNSQLFEAYLKCPTKCWLLSRGESGHGNAFAEWVETQSKTYRAEGIQRLKEAMPEGECAVTPLPREDLRAARWRLALEFEVRADGLVAQFDAVEWLRFEDLGRATQLIPIRFSFKNKLTRDDCLLMTFDARVLSDVTQCEIGEGKIVHGDDYATLKVKTSALMSHVRKLVREMSEAMANNSPPELVLIRHCDECGFRDRCRQKAIEKDDLSLLAGMTATERKKFHNKGIFTVTQLSYTFRPRRRPKGLSDKREKYQHALKALAIREMKVHIVGRPELMIQGTPVYLDVEAVPDRDFYYLIGMRIGNGELATQHSLWADQVVDEGNAWRNFLAILESVENPVLVHYGRFEKNFWKRMGERHGEPSEGSKAAKALTSAINLVTFFFAQVYFPTYSNRLKEIASWRSFSWSDPSLSGPNSIACRSEWEALADPTRKQRLITYNAEDCKALESLTCFANELCRFESTGPAPPASNVVIVDKLKPLKRFNLISKDGAALPEFKEINKAAYWDYQRHRIYVRSSKVIKKASKRNLKRKPNNIRIQKTIVHPDPSFCPLCGGVDLRLRGTTNLLTYDIKFLRSGAKGLARRQVWSRYFCTQCQELVRPRNAQIFTDRKYGLHLRAYAVSQLIELRISGAKVARSLNQKFHFDLTGSLVSSFKSDFAVIYGNAVKQLTDRIVTGSLVHADETQARTVGKTGYAWVLSSLEEVVYLYTDSREGVMIWSLLENFRGVLVSDFYAVYDSIKCSQQKCLIHLMRDINDDLHKYPFDGELQKIAQHFADLLKPIVESIDKRGLKKHFLSKFTASVVRFYSWLSKEQFSSEASTAYEKRFTKYRDKLFTFLKHDGVPWNNNNAENAIRAFGELRDIIKGVTTEKGLREYLVLLSLCETCKRRGISFLTFLCSGETDLDLFAGRKRTLSKRVARQRKTEVTVSPPQEPLPTPTPTTSESTADQLPSRAEWEAQYERVLLQNELAAWSRFICPTHLRGSRTANPLVRLERYDGMPGGGALAALPALVESGLAGAEELFPTIIERSLQEVAVALIAVASVSQTASIEALQLRAPTSWKRMLFSERLPNSQSMADLIKLIASAPFNVARWKANCVGRFLAKISRLDGLLSVGGCRRLYVDGEGAGSSSESARRMLLARCSLGPWEQALKGKPFFMIYGSFSSDRSAWLSKHIFSRSSDALDALRPGKILPAGSNYDRLTVIFGGGGFFPAFFEHLLRAGHHVLSYVMSVESRWPEGEFRPQDVRLSSGRDIRMQFAERVVPLADGACFRELRCLTGGSWQTGFFSSDREMDLRALASNIMVDFDAARFLNYLHANSALDRLCEGIVEPTQSTAATVNRADKARSYRAADPHHATRELLNAIKLISFRAENIMAQILRELLSQPDDAVHILQNLLNCPADLVADPKREILRIRLHTQFQEGYVQAVRHLCSELTSTEIAFPATDLRMIYEVASPG